MKKILLMALAAVTILSSCSKNEEVIDPNTKPAALRLAINTQATTRAIGTAGSNSTDIKSMKVIIYKGANGTGAVIDTKTLDAAACAKAKFIGTDADGSGGYYIESIDPSAVSVRVIAVLATGKQTGLTPFDNTVDINNWNGSAEADYFNELPFEGVGAIVKTGTATNPNGDGHPLWTVPVTIAPQLARFEIKGAIDLTGKNFYKNAVITAVYMNNITLNAAPIDVKLNAGNGNMNWGQGAWSTTAQTAYTAVSGSFRNMFTATALGAGVTDAYQLWAQPASPHVILAVTYQAAATWEWDATLNTGAGGWKVLTWESRNGYITIRKFNKTGDVELDAIEIGKLYQLDIAGLKNEFKDPANVETNGGTTGTDPVDPMPEADGVDLRLLVTVTAWDPISLTPKF